MPCKPIRGPGPAVSVSTRNAGPDSGALEHRETPIRCRMLSLEGASCGPGEALQELVQVLLLVQAGTWEGLGEP